MMYLKALPILAMLATMACRGTETIEPLNADTPLFPAGSPDGADPRSGTLSLVKECSGFTGAAGSHCDITESTLPEIELDSRITYLDPASVFTAKGSDVELSLPGAGDNVANGHCALDLSTNRGLCTFSGGTGKFQFFNANLTVSDPIGVRWHLNGNYSFTR